MLITEQQTINRYYQALVDREPSFVGIFYVGVKTTGIFCIATCRARKPKRKNVEFYSRLKDALDNGYRPCKICKPDEKSHDTPEAVEEAIALLKVQPSEKISDSHLREKGISPDVVRRWFKEHYGMTFHAYQRMYRINHAFQALKGGKAATETAFDSGYQSLSGFGYTYKKIVGRSPRQSVSQTMILINRFNTPLGPMFVCATDEGVCLLEFVDRRMLETEFKELQQLLKGEIIAGENEHIQQAQREVAEYFAGQRQQFTVSLHTPGTAFQQSVWCGLQQIPYGTMTTYQQQAVVLNKPKGVRAVAGANGRNRIAIIIPCHRVIGKDGALKGYGGGLERKRWLLDHEGAL